MNNIEEEIKRLEHQAEIYTKNAENCLEKADALKKAGDLTMPVADILEMLNDYRKDSGDTKVAEVLDRMEQEILGLCQPTTSK